MVQFDEPTLPAALAGRLTGVTASHPVHPVDEALAIELLDSCVDRRRRRSRTALLRADLPWKMLQRTDLLRSRSMSPR